MQVNENSVARNHVDSGNVGLSLTMGFGDYTGGEFTTGGKEIDITRRAVLVDGAVDHASNPYKGQRYSVILFAHSAWTKAPTELQEIVTMLGYNVPRWGSPWYS